MDMIGIIITLVTSIIGVAITIGVFIYQKKYPCRISCSCVDTIGLSTPSQFGNSKIELLLNGEKVKKEVNYVKCLLTNTGSRDIDCCLDNDDDKIEYKLPESNQWVELNVVTCSTGLKTKTVINKEQPNVAVLNLSRFRVGDSVLFEAIYEGTRDTALKVSHRLKNTNKIEMVENLFVPSALDVVNDVFKVLFLLVILPFMAIYLSTILPIPSNNVVRKDSLNNYVYTAELIGADSVYVYLDSHYPNLPEPETLSYEDFPQKYKTYSHIDRMHRNSYIVLGVGLCVFIIIVGLQIAKIVKKTTDRKKNLNIYKKLVSETT